MNLSNTADVHKLKSKATSSKTSNIVKTVSLLRVDVKRNQHIFVSRQSITDNTQLVQTKPFVRLKSKYQNIPDFFYFND